MSVNVSYATLGRNAVYFITEVIRNNLTDPHDPVRLGKNWIFKSQPTDPITSPSDLPRIVIDVSTLSKRRITLNGDKRLPNPLLIDAMIYSSGIGQRDELVDLMVGILEVDTSEDADGTSLKEQYLMLEDTTESVEDFYFESPEIVRAKRLTLTFKYYGS